MLTLLDAIAWLFNIRGNDVDFNPVAIGYAMITPEKATLFINPVKVSKRINYIYSRKALTLQPYDAFQARCNQFRAKFGLIPIAASWWVGKQLRQAHCFWNLPQCTDESPQKSHRS